MLDSIQPILPLIGIVVFWGVIFIFAFWFTRRALLAPREEEHEEASGEKIAEIATPGSNSPAH